MKKYLAVFLMATMLVSMAGCSSSSETATSSDASSSAAVESTGEVKKITIAHGASESYHMHRALLQFEETLEATGMFDITIYPSSQFGNDTEMIESVKTGDITMAIPPSSFLTDEAPTMALIELPYVFPSREAAIATLDGEWGDQQLLALQDSGLYGMGYLENGLRHITNSKVAIRTPEDMDGLKLRTMEVAAHVTYWNSLGCSAEGSPFAELYTNLSTKVFDGQENPIAHIHAQKFNEVQSYLTLSGHVYTTYVPVMQMDYWNSLSAEEQAIMSDAMESAYAYQLELVEAEEAGQLEEIGSSTTYPCEVIVLTDEEKQAFIDSAQPTLDQYKGDLGEDVYYEFIAAIEAVS
ncbi:DctP family TRAP transporter solute-binding subunit [Chakrabartyella piscis]|uniref:DctP family TRAP transporter solute-binding subunit n=1 Tax=Chakrabartyella piscis TaxID=2918914 RepID=UPI002958DEC6|nr:DctP family TRAP transporter solute-binding subunit [Chakrabartyella piscis]